MGLGRRGRIGRAHLQDGNVLYRLADLLLAPVPEPSPVILLLAMLLAVAFVSRKRILAGATFECFRR
jgi:hypothetical protein